jgi:hypothetical protein
VCGEPRSCIGRRISNGDATSRAAVVTHTLERERRRQLAAKDPAILAKARGDHEMDDLADYAMHVPMEALD